MAIKPGPPSHHTRPERHWRWSFDTNDTSVSEIWNVQPLNYPKNRTPHDHRTVQEPEVSKYKTFIPNLSAIAFFRVMSVIYYLLVSATLLLTINWSTCPILSAIMRNLIEEGIHIHLTNVSQWYALYMWNRSWRCSGKSTSKALCRGDNARDKIRNRT